MVVAEATQFSDHQEVISFNFLWQLKQIDKNPCKIHSIDYAVRGFSSSNICPLQMSIIVTPTRKPSRLSIPPSKGNSLCIMNLGKTGYYYDILLASPFSTSNRSYKISWSLYSPQVRFFCRRNSSNEFLSLTHFFHSLQRLAHLNLHLSWFFYEGNKI